MFDFLKKNKDTYEIIVPATSANLGPGFDTLGISFELFNHFIIKRSDKYEFVNVKEEYQNTNNLVIVAARKTYEYLKVKEKPFSLEIKENVPVSRGLGSSATCILAGVIGGMLVSGKHLSDEEIVNIATSVEGHPDNIAPAYYGALTSSFLEDDNVIITQYDVSRDLIFTVLVPDFSLETKKAREVLPKEVNMKDAVYNISRVVGIPKAFEQGDVSKLLHLMSDKLHEPYRYPLIKDSDVFIRFAEKEKLPLCISGSGSTLLLISKESMIDKLNKVKVDSKWGYQELKVCKKGTTWATIND